MGLSLPAEDGKRHELIWLELHNNCTQPIALTVNGASIGSPTDEATVMDRLVRPDFWSPQSRASREERIPQDTSTDVGSTATIEPGQSLHFSLPAEHFNRNWNIHIPFRFKVPQVKCCRDETAWGGEPEMFLGFSFLDLPEAMRLELDKARAKK